MSINTPAPTGPLPADPPYPGRGSGHRLNPGHHLAAVLEAMLYPGLQSVAAKGRS